MNRVKQAIISGFAVFALGLSGYGVYRYMSNKDDENEPIPNEPFAAGNLDIEKDSGGGITNSPPSTGSVSEVEEGTALSSNEDANIPITNYDREIDIGILDEGELVRRITPKTETVTISSPYTYLSPDGQLELDAIQQLVVNRATQDGQIEQKVQYVDPVSGTTYNSEQELFDAFIQKSYDVAVSQGLLTGQEPSVHEALASGSGSINVTNFITELPDFFPKATRDTSISPDFYDRATALQKTLTVNNPGSSSSAGLPNFSRLAAVGADLSKVDLYSVRNPDFLGEIKKGTKVLTREQRALINKQRLKNDPRNETLEETLQRQLNVVSNRAKSAKRRELAMQLTLNGFNSSKAKQYLLTKGVRVSGGLTPEQYVALAQRGGFSATNIPNPKPLQPKLNTRELQRKVDDIRSPFLKAKEQFFRQTGRTSFANMTQAEIFAWNRLLQSFGAI